MSGGRTLVASHPDGRHGRRTRRSSGAEQGRAAHVAWCDVSSGTVAVLLLLWGAVLVPGMVRDHQRSPRASVDRFAHAMRRLGGVERTADPRSRSVVVPGGAARRVAYPPDTGERRLRRRRRAVLARLVLLVVVAVPVAALVGGVAWVGAGAAAVLLLLYVALLRSIALRQQHARRVVRVHPTAQRRPNRPATRPATRPLAAGEGP